MIFYDKKRKRKFYFWGISAFAVSVVLGASLYIVLSVMGVSADAVSLSKTHSHYSNLAGSKEIALTFDDGPHPVHTREVVRVLKKHNVPATFFVVGDNVFKHKDVVKEVYDAGFEIGNHTFTHSSDVHVSEERLKWELNATNVLIGTITGKTTTLYRPPFLLDIGERATVNPDVTETPLLWAADNGYYSVGIDIDTKDFEAKSPADVIATLEKDMINASAENRHVVLMHDGGADVRHTPAALETIILGLKSKGYKFVPASKLLGLSPVEAMPLMEHGSVYHVYFHKAYIAFASSAASAVIFIIWVVSALFAFRVFFVLLLRYIIAPGLDSGLTAGGLGKNLGVSVVIPAYNEEENIESTIKSIMNNSLRPGEVIVVNDGSTDNTSSIAKRVQGEYPDVVRVIDKKNGGKADALNVGIGVSKGEVIIALDADTIFDKNAIENLARHFQNEKVGAVAGKIYPAVAAKLLEKFQVIEYVTTQNVEKQGMSAINAVGVVPGAVSAWRKSAVIEAGGYSGDTLVEDQDLTLAVLRLGYRVVYEKDAIAYTEVPTTIRGFVQQRFRWVFGTMQCSWKYKKSLFSRERPGLGWAVLPNITIYGVFVPLISPIFDFMFVFFLFTNRWQEMLVAYMVFTLFDLTYALVALNGENGRKKLIWVIILQRFYYRQLMTYALIKSLIRAASGTHASWGKLERVGRARELFDNNFEGALSMDV